jgi:hypothetical protein
MSIKSVLEDLLAVRSLSIPKPEVHWAGRNLEWMNRVFANGFRQTDTTWEVACMHLLSPPASEGDIANVAESLEISVPSDLREFWQISNGAELFVAMCRGEEACIRDSMSPGSSRIVRYKLSGTSDIIRLNRDLFRIFKECYPDCKDMKLNYIAFCEAMDGNYQSMLLEQPGLGKVFMLHHEHIYCPHDEKHCILNDTLAESLEAWFRLLIDTGGFGGRGENVGSM